METAVHVLSFERWSRLLRIAALGTALILPAVPGPRSGARRRDARAQAQLHELSCGRSDLARTVVRGYRHRYDGKPDARAYLVRKIQTGGVGAWGSAPMPANTQIDDAQTQRIVDWILRQTRR
ncbi:MAG: hypothetical protein WDN30_12120 [Pararobbsia sp.]